MHRSNTPLYSLKNLSRRLAIVSLKTALVPLLAITCAAAKPKLPVLAFYTEWSPPGSIDYSKITHLLLAFSLPQGGGSVQGFVPGGVVGTAHAAGVKVLASVGGANHAAAFPGIAASSGARTTFANSLKSLCDANGLDGVDIDWEYPLTVQDSANFTLLLKAVRAALPTRIISIDIAADAEKGTFVHKSALTIPDFVNVMSYDFTGSFPGSVVGQHASYAKATSNLNYWRAKGVPRNKLILGVPFYGKDFNQGGEPVAYKTIMANNPGVSLDADSVGRCWYNGVTTMKKKATYVAQMAYGGIMIWESSQDAGGNKSLLDAVNSGLLAEPLVGIAVENGRLRKMDQAGKVWHTLTGQADGLQGFRTGAVVRDALGHAHSFSAPGANGPGAGAYFTLPDGR